MEDKRKHFERKGANSRVKKTDELKMIHNLSKPLDLIHFPKPSKTLITKTHFSSSGPYGHVSPPILRFKSNSFLLYERTSLSIRASTISSSALTSPPEEDAESTQLFEVCLLFLFQLLVGLVPEKTGVKMRRAFLVLPFDIYLIFFLIFIIPFWGVGVVFLGSKVEWRIRMW